ncbi:endonuclease domain-containing protein [Streptomyces sp. x-80]|uniref:endonuclease domain-containing protein n=1 Tax=Streptomyces sp. x-80 TaxID=2789282 RepID=UPI00398059E2
MNRFRFPSVAAVREFRASREFRCEICRRQWEPGMPSFHIDHDRRCCSQKGKTCGQCTRGLLCGACNTTGLAWYENVGRTITSISLFEDYLTKYQQVRW